jgi:hypothetical protein
VVFEHHLFYAVGQITYDISRMVLTRLLAGVVVVALVVIEQSSPSPRPAVAGTHVE